MNKAILLGNLGADPETKVVGDGKTVTKFSLATTRKDHTEWHKVVTWDKLADSCGEYLKKGSKVLVEGEIQTRSWEAEDGSKRYATEIVARNVQFLTPKEKQEGGGF